MTVTARRITGLNLDVEKELETMVEWDADGLYVHVFTPTNKMIEVAITPRDLLFYRDQIAAARIVATECTCR